jgi:hypothetical protein
MLGCDGMNAETHALERASRYRKSAIPDAKKKVVARV